MTLILGIETSCDETAASVVADGQQVVSNVIASQHDLHRAYQGVVPEIASRAHLERILPVIDQALHNAHANWDQIDAVAVGNRPGLIGSLMVGVATAKALAWSRGKPLIGIDHVQAHLYAAALTDHHKPRTGPAPQYPAVGLVVSGGHSNLYEATSPTQMQLIGRTIDDAVGEAYDKAAVILGLGYPGGPNLDRLAQTGDPNQYTLPRPLLGKDSLDFSFSGLKTALLYTARGRPQGRGAAVAFQRTADDLTNTQRADMAAAFQAAAIETLIAKLGRAIDQLTHTGRPPRSVIIGGGVSANSLLRPSVAELGQQRGIGVCVPAIDYCLDNAAMIAGLAYHRWAANEADGLELQAVATASV